MSENTIRYKKLKMLGKGSYSSVYKIRSRSNSVQTKNIKNRGVKKLKTSDNSDISDNSDNNDSCFALKKYKTDFTDGVSVDFIREISSLKSCNHPNIVSILNIDLDNFKYIIIPLYKHNLREYIKLNNSDKNNPDTINVRPINVRPIIHQILKGIYHLHSNGIIHRDIKPDNIMIKYNNYGQIKDGNLIIEKDLEVVIIDLGLSKVMDMEYSDDTSHTEEVYTLWYRAPEILLGSDKYHFQTDMWSIGCILGEMLYGEALFKGMTPHEQLNLIFKLLGTPNEKTWKGVKSLPKYTEYYDYPGYFYRTFKSNPSVKTEFKDPMYDLLIELLEVLLIINPAHRCLSHEALKHPYISSYKDPSKSDSSKSILHFKDNYMNIMTNKTVNINLDRIFYQDKEILTENMRKRLLIWLMEVKDALDLNFTTYFRCQYILDTYTMIKSKTFTTKNYQLVGATCMFIATKLAEKEISGIKDYIYLCADVYTKNEMLMMEKDILKTLQMELNHPTSYDFLNYHGFCMNLNKKQLLESTYILIFITYKSELMKYRPYLLCFCACYYVKYLKNKSKSDSEHIYYDQIYKPNHQDLLECKNIMYPWLDNNLDSCIENFKELSIYMGGAFK
jgi:serine/threonine protein kinase